MENYELEQAIESQRRRLDTMKELRNKGAAMHGGHPIDIAISIAIKQLEEKVGELGGELPPKFKLLRRDLSARDIEHALTYCKDGMILIWVDLDDSWEAEAIAKRCGIHIKDFLLKDRQEMLKDLY